MRLSDLIAGIFLVVAGLVLIFGVIPAQIGSRSFGGLPPDFFPRVLAWIFLGLAVLLVAARGVAFARQLPQLENADPPLKWRQALFISGAGLCLLVTYWLMANVGYIWAGVFAVGVIGIAMGELKSHPLRLVLMMALGPLLIDIGFRHLFLVFLPG